MADLISSTSTPLHPSPNRKRTRDATKVTTRSSNGDVAVNSAPKIEHISSTKNSSTVHPVNGSASNGAIPKNGINKNSITNLTPSPVSIKI